MKHVQACLRAREYRESSFHHCGGTVSLVQACLCEGKTRFNHRGSAVKHVEASVSARAYGQSSFHRCGGPYEPVYVRERPDNDVLTSEEVQ